jgi:adenine-specific DNA-methyltransferase
MTELIWDGKYKDGKRVAPVRIALPFQTIESVNESAQVRAHQYDLWSQGRPTEWRNRLIWGDKKYVLPSLLPEFAGKVNLIYIDPPYATGADFSLSATIPDIGEEFTKEPSIIEQKAYRDMWGRGLDGYLQWFYETVTVLKELLNESGSLYVHSDWRLSHSIKLVLDEVFGVDNFINEIIWKRRAGLLHQSRQFGAATDTILFYAKTPSYIWNQHYTKVDTEDYVKERFKYVDSRGRRYRLSPIVSPSYSPTLVYEYKGYKPPRTGWSLSLETMKRFDAEGRLEFPQDTSQRIQRRQYLDEWEGRLVQSLWDDIPPRALHNCGYGVG